MGWQSPGRGLDCAYVDYVDEDDPAGEDGLEQVPQLRLCTKGQPKAVIVHVHENGAVVALIVE